MEGNSFIKIIILVIANGASLLGTKRGWVYCGGGECIQRASKQMELFIISNRSSRGVFSSFVRIKMDFSNNSIKRNWIPQIPCISYMYRYVWLLEASQSARLSTLSQGMRRRGRGGAEIVSNNNNSNIASDIVILAPAPHKPKINYTFQSATAPSHQPAALVGCWCCDRWGCQSNFLVVLLPSRFDPSRLGRCLLSISS